VQTDDWTRAQVLADTLSPEQLHRTLDRMPRSAVRSPRGSGQGYHWSLMQVEYTTFRRAPLTAVHFRTAGSKIWPKVD
jgi:hypothetical protein